MPGTQLAVLRNGGCNSAESDCKIARVVPRITFSEPRHYAKPLGRYRQAGRERGESEVKRNIRQRHADCRKREIVKIKNDRIT
jgi:hypothetical protein